MLYFSTLNYEECKRKSNELPICKFKELDYFVNLILIFDIIIIIDDLNESILMFVYEVMSLAMFLIMKTSSLYVEKVEIIMIEDYYLKHYFINSFIMLSFA